MISEAELSERPDIDPDMTDEELEAIATRVRRRLPWGAKSTTPTVEDLRPSPRWAAESPAC